MLARASSDAGTRLRRSKSTRTAQRHSGNRERPSADSLDADVAQQYAIAAATTAFVRAHAGETANLSRSKSSATLSRSKSNATLSRSQSNTSRKSLATQGSHFPPRELSVPALQQPRLPPPTFNENMRPNSQLKPYRPVVSATAASQRLRKARSMYYASSVQTGSPIPRPPAMYLTTPPSMSMTPALQVPIAPLSARATISSPLVSPRLPTIVAPHETVDKARDKYLHDFQHRQVKHRPSLFFAPFKKRQDKEKLPKNPPSSAGGVSRSSQYTPVDTPSLDIAQSDFQTRKDKKEKRSFSGSIKNKFKKVFRRSSNNATTLPIQQIEASRDYFGDYSTHVEPPSTLHGSSAIPSPDEHTLQRIMSRTPSFDGDRHALIRSASRSGSQGSNRSLHSETEISFPSTSRVTSWSSSSVNGTLTQRDVKRLTVIHEAKDSIGSDKDHCAVTASPKRKPPSIPGFTAFREPMPMESLVEEASTPVDPKRMFSALMKEIDASKVVACRSQQASDGDSDVFVSSVSKDSHLSPTLEPHSSTSRDFRVALDSDQRSTSRQHSDNVAVSSKTSSIRSFGRAIRSTIRAVTPSEQMTSQASDRTNSVRGVVRIPRPGTAASSSTTTSGQEGSQDAGESVGPINFKMHSRRSSGRPPTRDTFTEIDATATAEQIEQRVQKSKGRWKTSLEETRIPFFPRLTNRTFAVVNIAQMNISGQTSNEQMATQESTKKSEVTIEEQEYISGSASPNSPRQRPIFSPLSPSVYSRNTDGVSLLPNDSVMSFDEVNGDDERGSAIIIASHSVKRHVIGTPSPNRDIHSARSSRDWRAWLSHEVSELENLPQEEITIHERYGTPEGHCREILQSNDKNRTIAMCESVEMSTLQQKTTQAERQTPRVGGFSVKSAAPTTNSPKSSKDEHTPRLGIPRHEPSLLGPKVECKSSVSSDRMPLARVKLDNQSLERMNDRFPFIHTGRKSSSNSAQLPRLSRHTPDSGCSSANSKTSSPKVYSDFSAPSTDRASKHEMNVRAGKTEASDSGKEKNKENAALSPNHGALGVHSHDSTQSLPITIPKSLQPLISSSSNRTLSILNQYTTTATKVDAKPRRNPNAANAIPRPRLHAQVQSISPGRLTVRPKSAFDLRASNIPLVASQQLNSSCTGSDSSRKRERCTGTVVSSPPNGTFAPQTINTEALRMVLDSPWVVNYVPSSRSSLEQHVRRPLLPVNISSSTPARNREPSPGGEEREIESVLGVGERQDRDIEGRGGSMTPGQRLADRFLRERSVGTGAESPINMSVVEGGEREELTPVFL